MIKTLPKDSLGYKIYQLLIQPDAGIKIAILINNDKSLQSLGCRNSISAEEVESTIKELVKTGRSPEEIVESIISKIEMIDK